MRLPKLKLPSFSKKGTDWPARPVSTTQKVSPVQERRQTAKKRGLFGRRNNASETEIDPKEAMVRRSLGQWRQMTTKLNDEKRGMRGVQQTYASVREAHSSPSLISKILRLPGKKLLKREPAGAHPIYANRVERQREQQVRGWVSWWRARVKLLIAAFVGVILIIAAGVGIYILHQNQVYVITEIEVAGNTQTSELAFLSQLDYLKGKSLLTTNVNEVVSKLLKDFPYLKTALVRKVLPGKLQIEVTERFPYLAYLNLSGCYLMDEEGVIVTVVFSEDIAPLNANELLILEGYGDPNANYVYEKYRAGIDDEEERAAVKWEEVPESAKKSTLNSLREEVQLRVNSLINNGVQALQQTTFATLPQVYGNDAAAWKLGDRFDNSKFESARSVVAYLTQSQLTFTKMQWQTDFTLAVDLAEGKKLLFTSTREIEEQLTALEALRTKIDFAGVSLIDLRSELVAVR